MESLPEPPSVDALVAWIREAAAMVERSTDYVVSTSDERAFRQLWGICLQSVRHSSAYALLVEKGYDREAMVLARAALEHAISAQWAFHWIDGLPRLAVEMVRGDRDYRRMMGDWLDNDEIKASVDLIDVPAGKGMPKFIDVMRAVDEGKFLETTYGNLSLANHVRASTQASYFHIEGDQLLVRYTPAHHLQGPATNAAAMAATLAVAILMELAGDQEAMTRIGEISDELVLPCTLRPGVDPTNRRKGPGTNTPWASLSDDV